MEKAVKLIHGLEPKPGRAYSKEKTVPVVPDMIIQEKDGKYSVEMNNKYVPALRVSAFYSKLMKDKNTDEEAKEYLAQKRDRARWVINAIKQRQDTIRRIAEFIAAYQKDFFDDPQNGMKPLKMDDAAKELSLSQSTISRAVFGKYVQTDMGTLPLKYFFSAAIEREKGEAVSVERVKNMIRDLIKEEDDTSPLSDRDVVIALGNSGINVARRTVAKYREALNIPPAHKRKRT